MFECDSLGWGFKGGKKRKKRDGQAEMEGSKENEFVLFSLPNQQQPPELTDQQSPQPG